MLLGKPLGTATGVPALEPAGMTVLDKLTYSGNLADLTPARDGPRLPFVQADVDLGAQHVGGDERRGAGDRAVDGRLGGEMHDHVVTGEDLVDQDEGALLDTALWHETRTDARSRRRIQGDSQRDDG